MPDYSVAVSELPHAIEWKDGELYLLDQTLLPQQELMEQQRTVEQVWQAIRELKVRGAPAIGIAAAYGLCVALKDRVNLSVNEFIKMAKEKAAFLDSARPTAVNLSWAMKRMVARLDQVPKITSRQLYESLIEEAEKIHAEDIALCQGMGKMGAPLIKDGMGIMTHCNAGSIATSATGTATAPMYMAHQNGVGFKVYANETRPLLQGARLTSWELQKAGLDVTLITDNMAAHMMATGQIDMVIVGTDRVAANGDVANKIGTLGVAILADYYQIPFYVACPSSTIDMETACGRDIEIEERSGDEVTTIMGKRIAPENIKTRCPAFDVTPNKLVRGIITENQIITAPYDEGLREFFKGKENG
ncbi:MAG TPA: S-methyl-5-thioribose-1-phosphate isomerase [Emcibacteraceae bacterium]|nr:S-methyl-5-thioribose-1-phosphate isomerase [Emcibacteraceae bacterium]